MNKFMLAAKKLTASGQGKTSYAYFEAFMETVQGFPVVPQSMSTYYAVQPTVDIQTIDTLFFYLKSQHPYVYAADLGSFALFGHLDTCYSPSRN